MRFHQISDREPLEVLRPIQSGFYFIALFTFCAVMDTYTYNIHIKLETSVIRQLSASHQAVVRQLSGSLQAVVRQLSGTSRQADVRQMSGSRKLVIRQASGSRQAVVNNISDLL